MMFHSEFSGSLQNSDAQGKVLDTGLRQMVLAIKMIFFHSACSLLTLAHL